MTLEREEINRLLKTLHDTREALAASEKAREEAVDRVKYWTEMSNDLGAKVFAAREETDATYRRYKAAVEQGKAARREVEEVRARCVQWESDWKAMREQFYIEESDAEALRGAVTDAIEGGDVHHSHNCYVAKDKLGECHPFCGVKALKAALAPTPGGGEKCACCDSTATVYSLGRGAWVCATDALPGEWPAPTARPVEDEIREIAEAIPEDAWPAPGGEGIPDMSEGEVERRVADLFGEEAPDE